MNKIKLKKTLYRLYCAFLRPFGAFGKALYHYQMSVQFETDWSITPNPEWFDHELDLLFFEDWRKPHFFERGIYSSEVVRQKRVLDLCCGDGSMAALFISPLASQVTAIDFDPNAISHAKRRWSKFKNVKYEEVDVRQMNYPAQSFDVCLWEAAIEHFTQAEMDKIIHSVQNSLATDGVMHGHTIKKLPQLSHHDHEYEFETLSELDSFLKKYFPRVETWERVYEDRTNFYFRCYKK
jgi:ubiquinone/menaquinone biosynthesis C-methylase UbiE